MNGESASCGGLLLRRAASVNARRAAAASLSSLKAVVLPVLIIIMVLGSIYFGVCTATEAATLGALGALLSAAIYRKLNWALLKEACYRTASLTGMIVWILIGAYCFTAVYTGTGAHELMEKLLLSIPGGRYAILITMQNVFFILGCFLDPAGIIMICTPVFVPVIKSLGFDPLWFGVLFIMNMVFSFFETFGIIHAVTQGGPGDTTTIMVYKTRLSGSASSPFSPREPRDLPLRPCLP